MARTGRKFTISVFIPDRYNWRPYFKEDLENALNIIGRRIIEGETSGTIDHHHIEWDMQETETYE